MYRDTAGGDHSENWAQFFSGGDVKFTTNLGKIGSKVISVPMNFGKAIATLTATEGNGLYILTATLDSQTLKAAVNVGPEVSAATVGMQKTGLPLNYLGLAILIAICGLLVPKRN